MIVPPGSTQVSVDVEWYDDTGAAVTGKVAADFPAVKWSSGTNTADTPITLSDLAAITTAHPNDNTAGGVKERGGGKYRLDLPNNMFTAAGHKGLTFAETTNKRLVAPRIDVQYVQADVAAILAATADGITLSVLLARLNGFVKGRRTVVNNNDGTWTISIKAEDNATTLFSITFNPTTGAVI